MFVTSNYEKIIAKSYSSDCAPSYLTEPLKPSFVNEGKNITLHWTYNIDGTFQQGEFRLIPSKIIARKTDSGLTVNSGYQNRITVVASASETTITLHAVTRLDSGDYRYTIENNNFESAESDVEVTVRCK